MNDLYLSCALPTCFDDVTPPVSDPPVAPPAAPPATPPAGEGKTFTQDDVNRIVAEDRRKTLAQSEKQFQDLLATKNLTEEQRQSLETSLATVQGQLRTKEQQAAIEKKQLEETYTTKLTEAQKKAQEWENRYRESTITRELKDAAGKNDAYDADQIVMALEKMTKLVEVTDASGKPTGQHEVVIDFPDVDPTTGQTVMTTRTPDETVKRMREIGKWANLFKSNVVSGIGSNNAAGLPAGGNGKVDLKALAKNPEQFRKVLKENPELLGLSRRSLRR